jgi:tight adherence protein B
MSSLPRNQKLWLLLLPLLFAGLSFEWLRIFGFSVAVLVGGYAIEYEWVQFNTRRWQREVTDCWPLVIESLESAALGGLSLIEAMRDLAEMDQLTVAKCFKRFCSNIDSGATVDAALVSLKQEFQIAPADFTIEVLRSVNELGSGGYVNALRHQQEAIRSAIELSTLLQAKQGWVVGTAKIAVAAPWLIVAILALRPENSVTYNSLLGNTLLVFGVAVSILALRIVYRIGYLNQQPRVFQ